MLFKLILLIITALFWCSGYGQEFNPIQSQSISTENLLSNSGFESGKSGWTLGSGTITTETSVVFKGKNALKVSLPNQVLSVIQDSTRYAGQYADNPNGVAYAMVKASNSAVKLCPRQAGVTSSTCYAHSGSGKWELLKIDFALGATSNGVAIITSTGIGSAGTPAIVYIDNVYVGVKSPEILTCSTTLDCTDTLSFNSSSTATVSNENVEFVNGNGSITNTSQFTYTFNTNVFTVAPNCVCSVITNSVTAATRACQPVTTTSSSVSVFTTSAGSASPLAHTIVCQKQGADYIGKTTKAVASSQNLRSPGVENVVVYSGMFSSAANSITACSSGTCAMTGDLTGSATASFVSTGKYSLVFPSGSFDASTLVSCQFKCNQSSTTNVSLDSTSPAISNVSGGITLDTVGCVTVADLPARANSSVVWTCTGVKQ